MNMADCRKFLRPSFKYNPDKVGLYWGIHCLGTLILFRLNLCLGRHCPFFHFLNPYSRKKMGFYLAARRLFNTAYLVFKEHYRAVIEKRELLVGFNSNCRRQWFVIIAA